MKQTAKIVAICVICTATMMCGCLEERTPEGYLIRSDGTVDIDDRKSNKVDKAADDQIYKCDMQSGIYVLDMKYPSQLNGLLSEFEEYPSEYNDMHLNGHVEINKDGQVESCRLYITGDHIADKSVTRMSILYVKPKAVGTIGSGYKHTEITPPKIVFDRWYHTLQPNTKMSKSISITSEGDFTENMIFMDTITEILSENSVLGTRNRDVKQIDARDFVNLYPTLTIHQIDSVDNAYNCHVFGWMAVLDDNVVDGDLQIQANRGDPPGGDYINFRGFITVDYTSRDATRKAAIFSLI